MKLSSSLSRRLLLAGAFVTTLLAAVLAPSQESAAPVVPEARPANRTAQASGQPGRDARTAQADIVAVAEFRRQLEPKVAIVDMFQAQKPPGASPAPAAKPEAPKLPITYVGRVEDEAAPRVVLMHAGQVLVLRAGEQLPGNTYRLEEIERDKLVFSYLPLSVQQILPTGEMK